MTRLIGAVLVLVLVGVEGAGTPAHVQSQYRGQLVTSSTLIWHRAGLGHPLPDHWVDAGAGAGPVCRGYHHGAPMVGSIENGRCRVGFANRLVSLTNYEVLASMPGAAKLDWRHCSRFSSLPAGAVAGVEGRDPVFVARKLGNTGRMWPAVVIMPSTGVGTMKVYREYEVEDVFDGDVLVEVEPVRYEIILDKYAKPAKISRTKKVFASSSIFRFQEGRDSVARMQKMITYVDYKSLYLGHIKGAIKGLPTVITFPDGTKKSLSWGLVDSHSKSEAMMVGYDMKQNSAVDVALAGEAVVEDQLYTGVLKAVFADGSSRERQVEGELQVRYLENIQPEYSQLYQIKDQIMTQPEKFSLNANQGIVERSPSDKVRENDHISLAVQSSAVKQCGWRAADGLLAVMVATFGPAAMLLHT